MHLTAHGWSQQLGSLESQLKTALRDHPPDADTADIAAGLLQLLAARGAAEVLTIGDGLGPS